MSDRKLYEGKFIVLSGWALKAVGLVVVGAVTMVVALTVARHVSVEPASPKGGKLVGAYHEAAIMSPAADTSTRVSSAGFDQDPDTSPHTVVHNGLTVVTPELLVPVIDLASLEAVSGSDGNASVSKTSSAQKRSSYGKSSQSHRQTRSKAYGVAIR